jgi:hypothetical protein
VQDSDIRPSANQPAELELTASDVAHAVRLEMLIEKALVGVLGQDRRQRDHTPREVR